MQIFIKDDITKETYQGIANFSKLEKVTDKPSANNYFVYDSNGLSFVKDSINPKEVLHVDFLSGTLGWRLKRVNHERNLRKALGKTDKQLSIFDSTAGLLTDTMIFLSLGHKVVAVEQSKIIYSLVKDAILRAKDKIPELKNLIFLNDNSLEVYKSTSKEFDVIYLDPMYPYLNKKNKKSGRLENIKKILEIENFRNCGENLVKDFFDLEYKKIILKRPLKYQKNYSNINYQVLGKTTRFDIYL
jgi:16S rRNA (guanine1516-N2)-methyltransferase